MNLLWEKYPLSDTIFRGRLKREDQKILSIFGTARALCRNSSGKYGIFRHIPAYLGVPSSGRKSLLPKRNLRLKKKAQVCTKPSNKCRVSTNTRGHHIKERQPITSLKEFTQHKLLEAAVLAGGNKTQF
ncbi:hypothetical protein ElyMa_001163100 [Elysia marginata]|uniref:Uncharacterized protein n=1 Tax=Elysia marginata TaxID=1093978 RepID=A0AAV4I0L9_9GAST|nr:hypothetical protein ElyMa_001163100 [Elysia marginata]